MTGQIAMNPGGTQCDKILRHMKDVGSITSREAMWEYGIMRLASRISDLKKAGYDIGSETVADTNRYGEMTRFSKYFFNGGGVNKL